MLNEEQLEEAIDKLSVQVAEFAKLVGLAAVQKPLTLKVNFD